MAPNMRSVLCVCDGGAFGSFPLVEFVLRDGLGGLLGRMAGGEGVWGVWQRCVDCWRRVWALLE